MDKPVSQIELKKYIRSIDDVLGELKRDSDRFSKRRLAREFPYNTAADFLGEVQQGSIPPEEVMEKYDLLFKLSYFLLYNKPEAGVQVYLFFANNWRSDLLLSEEAMRILEQGYDVYEENHVLKRSISDLMEVVYGEINCPEEQ